jgi:hypothetical protein
MESKDFHSLAWPGEHEDGPELLREPKVESRESSP